eukprot:2081820-Rhodomonas_salina.2
MSSSIDEFLLPRSVEKAVDATPPLILPHWLNARSFQVSAVHTQPPFSMKVEGEDSLLLFPDASLSSPTSLSFLSLCLALYLSLSPPHAIHISPCAVRV